MRQRSSKGQFIRKHQEWSLDNFDDGYVHKHHGRFLVYLPNHSRSSSMGYVYRGFAAYEKYHNIVIPAGYDIHHKDRNRLNDSVENLELIEHAEHAKQHNESKQNRETRKCIVCNKNFTRPKSRLNKKNRPGKYCSLTCYFRRVAH